MIIAPLFRILTLAAFLGGSLLVAGCDDGDGAVEEAAEDTGEAVEEAAEETQDAVD